MARETSNTPPPMNQTGTLQRDLEAGRFVLTAEIVPPLSAAREDLIARARPLEGLVSAINVTDAAGARAAMSSFAAAAMLRSAGYEPVAQVTCRDRNRIALAGDFLGAAAHGVGNFLILHGDSAAKGDVPDAREVHDLDSRGVMAMARSMSVDGKLPWGREIVSPPYLFIGAADTPFDPPAGWTPDGLAAKAQAGAQFVQTQFCFDPAVARRYFSRLHEEGITERVRIIAGTGPLASARSARWINDNLFGVSVPDDMIARLEGAKDPREEGIRICAEQMGALREIGAISGLHLMAPLQSAEAIAEAITRARLPDAG